MTSQQQEGFKRLALAIGVTWLAFWSYRLWRDYELVSLDARYHDIILALHGSDFFYDEAVSRLYHDIGWAFGVPLFLAIGYWVYRGSRASGDET